MPVLTSTNEEASNDDHHPPHDGTSATSAPASTPTELSAPAGRRPGPRLLAIGAGALVVLVAASTLIALASDEGTQPVESTPIRAVEAETRDLVETRELDGTLTYSSTRSVASLRDGTITSIVSDGDTVNRGDVVFEVDTVPVVAFFGDVPFYRTLAEGAEGDDVLILEQNLASLGYHTVEDDDGNETDTGFSVDGTFDAATTDAVLRWQDDIGLADTGEVDAADAVVVTGPSVASDLVVDIGSRVQAGSPVLELNMGAGPDSFYAQHSGEIELQVRPGDVLASGVVVYTVDEAPVMAIAIDPDPGSGLDADVVFDRDLTAGIADGEDVEALEHTLAALGFDADGDLEVDEVFDDATTDAITEWEEDIEDRYSEFVPDGTVQLVEIVIVDPGTEVGVITERDAELTATGSELFTTGTGEPTRVVETSIEVADQDKLTVGTTVEVEFPDGVTASGVVSDVATSSTIDPTDPDAGAVLAVEVSLDTIPDSVVGLTELDVDVKVVEELSAAATVVPASALVVTSDGGYAVEVVTGDDSTRFVAVDPGMFADGVVEVTGIDPGTAVVVPS